MKTWMIQYLFHKSKPRNPGCVKRFWENYQANIDRVVIPNFVLLAVTFFLMILKIKKQLFEVDKRKNLILTKTKGARWREEGERGGEREEERERRKWKKKLFDYRTFRGKQAENNTKRKRASLMCFPCIKVERRLGKSKIGTSSWESWCDNFALRFL